MSHEYSRLVFIIFNYANFNVKNKGNEIKGNNNTPNCIKTFKTERFVKVTIFTGPTSEDSNNLDRSKL